MPQDKPESPLSLYRVLLEEYFDLHGSAEAEKLFSKKIDESDFKHPRANEKTPPDVSALFDALKDEYNDLLNPTPTGSNKKSDLLNNPRYKKDEQGKTLTKEDAEKKLNDDLLPLLYYLIHRADTERTRCELQKNGNLRWSEFQGNTGQTGYATQAARSALCLSGGGIRSATFNLGILHGLARHKLLDKFDYLSTVSGGGFIGSWLSSWIARDGIKTVASELNRDLIPPLEPEPKPLTHLRSYSNYLSPHLGLISLDMMTLAATLLRNLILIWLVFVPFIVAVLMLPRFWYKSLFNLMSPTSECFWILLPVGAVLTFVSVLFNGSSLPSLTDANPSRRSVVLFSVLPLLGAALCFAAFWVGYSYSIYPKRSIGWYHFVIFRLILVAPWLLCAVWQLFKSDEKKWIFIGKAAAATFLIGFAEFVVGCLLYCAAEYVFKNPGAHLMLYATFAVPLLALLTALSGLLIAGFTSRYTNDEDQEWFARAGAHILLRILVWIVVCLIVFFGPQLILTLPSELGNKDGNFWLGMSKAAGVVIGIISGVITLFGGFSSKTPATTEEAQSASRTGRLLFIATNFVAPIFLVFILILLVTGTDFIVGVVWKFFEGNKVYDPNYSYNVVWSCASFLERVDWRNVHCKILSEVPLGWLAVTLGAILSLGFVMGWLISTNQFSLHYMWRNRIVRAYLGASKKIRKPNFFTDFDESDNLHMWRLRRYQPNQPKVDWKDSDVQDEESQIDPSLDFKSGTLQQRIQRIKQKVEAQIELEKGKSHKLLHVINITLNLVSGNNLAWQDRKAESFTVSPLHSGSFRVGYRRSWTYGNSEGDGISIGTATAISGAFVSPNMGYMMPSPIVRFLMTLFNIRFGWWLGNPGYAGYTNKWWIRIFNKFNEWSESNTDLRKTYALHSPILSVTPITYEALGKTNDTYDYVYLSDGGHFDNLGLYEMVLRRCRFIVVCDATTDNGYCFDDLGMAIRKIRIDLGVPITFKEFNIKPPLKGTTHYAVGQIQYSAVDRGVAKDIDGILLYIKPTLTGKEPSDILNYHVEDSAFPQNVIVDQFFSESQFESYHALGLYIIDAICGNLENDLAAVAQKIDSTNAFPYFTFNWKPL